MKESFVIFGNYRARQSECSLFLDGYEMQHWSRLDAHKDKLSQEITRDDLEPLQVNLKLEEEEQRQIKPVLW